jgi:predicted alpha-1,2-mannosidase
MNVRSTVPLLSVLLLAGACSDDDTRLSTPDAVAGGDALPADAAGDSGDASGEPDLSGVDVQSPDADVVTEPDDAMTVVEPAVWTGDDALQWVGPFVGTGGLVFGYSGLTPAAQVPNGLVKLDPDTTLGGGHAAQTHFSGYNYADTDVRGFSQLRLVGTGAADMANLRVLPLAERPERPFNIWTAFSHDEEAASPGYYEVRLPEEDVDVRLTASQLVGIHEYSYGSQGGYLVVDPTANLTDREVTAATLRLTESGFEGEFTWQGSFTGRKRPFTCYFVGEVDGAVADAVWTDDAWADATEVEGTRIAGLLRVEPDTTLRMNLAVSLIDLDQARANLAAQRFDTVDEGAAAARALWAEKMDHFEVHSDDEAMLGRFFTAAYNLYRMPSQLSEESGEYRGLDGDVHVADGFNYYSDLSLWDSFRTLHPLLEWVDPDFEVDVLRSLIAMGEQWGAVPRWPAMLSETGSMLGSPGDQLFGGAAAKGLDGVDYAHALELLLASLEGERRTRGAEALYEEYGYVPQDLHDESMSETLEYGWSDHALGQVARAAGDEEMALALEERGRSYLNLYNADENSLWPRESDGGFLDFNETSQTGRSGPVTEGTIWHWRFYVLHDPMPLIEQMGGAEPFCARLEQAFVRSRLGTTEGPMEHTFPDNYYWHGNQPSLGNVWLFPFCGQPERMVHWVSEIQERIYRTEPDGLPGNDDGGTLSAWFVSSALGFYPIAGTDRYVVGTALFDRVVVHPAGDRPTTTIVRASEGSGSSERTAVLRDGAEWTEPAITHADLVGAEFIFEYE